MKEKAFSRWLLIRFLLITGIFLLAVVVLYMSLTNTLSETISLGNSYTTEQILVTNASPELITVTDYTIAGGEMQIVLDPTMGGAGTATINVLEKESGETIHAFFITVRKDGLLIDLSTANFSHYMIRELCVVLLALSYSILLWVAFVKSRMELVFSYQSIFLIGFAIWVSVITVFLLIGYMLRMDMFTLYSILQNGAYLFMLYSFPVMLLFSILLSISNISLIRHEGFRFQNALGILLSFVIVAGAISIFTIDNLISSGSELQLDLGLSLVSVLYCAYALLECFLLGSVICGTIAASHTPDLSVDYIIILGCKIRKDGTLYPLIRGRVDRAISFYHLQLEQNGKKAYFVPSGGKGTDEPLSEAEGMQRYLIEQGISPEQILPETNSKTTRENMLFSRDLILNHASGMETPTIVFSTTNYHVFRSGIISRQAGLEMDGMGSPTKWYFWPNAYVREVIGMLSYKWKTLLIVFIPVVAFFTVVRFMF